MEQVAGLEELKPIVAALLEKELMVEITAPGRGQIVTHNLYEPEELARIRAAYADGIPPADSGVLQAREPATAADPELSNKIVDLESQIEKLWQTVKELRAELDEFKS
jgi:hypothetical protein